MGAFDGVDQSFYEVSTGLVEPMQIFNNYDPSPSPC
jgi:hypothetical protein